jgi:hypothetical protein
LRRDKLATSGCVSQERPSIRRKIKTSSSLWQ